MLVSISDQAYIFLYTVLGGIAVGLVYDFFRISRIVIKTHNVIVHFEDIAFWLIVSLVTLATLFISNAGEIRGYSLVGIILGVVIYYFMFSRLVVKVLVKSITAIGRIIVFLYKTIKKPIVFIMKLIYFPILYVSSIILKILKFCKRIYNRLFESIRLNIKNIKVTLKKY